ncbi:hypothetical protein AB0D10_01180 [Kitasatospora sp. NPDC048545]|uniref:hypothetical protein n=1 Tax=Kitasatospora sp. NPDC048545 TaxID=3157208 RepID=UPI0033D9E029
MRLAPLPHHNRTNDPAWKAMYDVYEPLITPMRRRQLVTDIGDCGGSTVIYAQLPDGTHLTITTGNEGSLPSSIDSVTSWLVTHNSDDNPTVDYVVYDSVAVPNNVYAFAGALIAPLLLAIDAFLEARKMPGAPADHPAVVTVTTVHETGPAGFATTRPFEHGHAAAEKHATIVDALAADGLHIAHHTGFFPWQQQVLVARDRVLIVQTTLAELVPGGRGDLQCFCQFAHPQTPEEDQRLHAEVAQALSNGDAQGVYLGMVRLATAPGCPARPKAGRRD